MNAPSQHALARPLPGCRSGQPRWLASVRSAREAAIALAAGADIIDAKEPRHGALGALPGAEIAAIVALVGGRAPVSATVGDLPWDPALLAPAMQAVAAAGADIVKIGVFGSAGADALARCLSALPDSLPRPGQPPAARVAVLMADQGGDRLPLLPFARQGFAGVMLDTADKSRGSLRRLLDPQRLARFVSEAQALGLWVGLAGSLAIEDIPALLPLGADYLGFRTALCRQGERAGTLDAAACRRVASITQGRGSLA